MKSPLTKFILKAVGFFLVWYVIYELWLLPDGTLDEWLSLNIIGTSKGILEYLGFEIYTYNRVLGIYGSPGVEVIDGCNGIAAIGLFIGFIISYPGSLKPKISFMLVGIGLIYLVNIIRISVLVFTQANWASFFEIAHNYATTGIFYLVVFFLWMIWVNENGIIDA